MVVNQFMVHAYMKFVKKNNFFFLLYIIRKTKKFHIVLRKEKLDGGVQFGQRRGRKQGNN